MIIVILICRLRKAYAKDLHGASACRDLEHQTPKSGMLMGIAMEGWRTWNYARDHREVSSQTSWISTTTSAASTVLPITTTNTTAPSNPWRTMTVRREITTSRTITSAWQSDFLPATARTQSANSPAWKTSSKNFVFLKRKSRRTRTIQNSAVTGSLPQWSLTDFACGCSHYSQLYQHSPYCSQLPIS